MNGVLCKCSRLLMSTLKMQIHRFRVGPQSVSEPLPDIYNCQLILVKNVIRLAKNLYQVHFLLTSDTCWGKSVATDGSQII